MNKDKVISQKELRHKRVRAKIKGTSDRPRLSVSRSNKHVFLQLIDDTTGKTVASYSDASIKDKGTKTEKARVAGKKIAEIALANKTKAIVFDKGGFKYHGRVKAVAEGAREGGLEF